MQDSQILNFFPTQPWPAALPRYFWHNYQITGFASSPDSSPRVALNPTFSLAQVLHACYPNLQLLELSRLRRCLNQLKPTPGHESNTLKELMQLQGYRLQESTELVLERALDLPPNFQQWVQEKKLGFKDLAILRSLPSQTNLTPLYDRLSTWGFSKNDGVKALELSCELFLMGTPLEQILGEFSTPQVQTWILHLNSLRYPQTQTQDLKNQGKLQEINWPGHVHTRWLREGDRSGIEIKVFAFSQDELNQRLTALEQMKQQLSQKEVDLWKI